MAMPFNAVAAAYSNASKLITDAGKASSVVSGTPSQTPDFGKLLGETGFRVEHVRGDVLVPIADEWTRPWARREEAVVKRLTGTVVRRRPRWAPWIEVYARRD